MAEHVFELGGEGGGPKVGCDAVDDGFYAFPGEGFDDSHDLCGSFLASVHTVFSPDRWPPFLALLVLFAALVLRDGRQVGDVLLDVLPVQGYGPLIGVEA